MYTLEQIQSNIDHYLTDLAPIRTESELASAQMMAHSFQAKYKLKSPEQKLLASFSKQLESIRKKRFPKVVKPKLSELPEDEPNVLN